MITDESGFETDLSSSLGIDLGLDGRLKHASGSFVDDGIEIAATLEAGSKFEHFLIR